MTAAQLLAIALASLLSGLVAGMGAVVAVRMMVVKLQTQMEERETQKQRRDKEVDEKFSQLHAALGMMGTNGGAYVRRGECLVMESAVREKLEAIKAELHQFRIEVDGRISSLEEGTS